MRAVGPLLLGVVIGLSLTFAVPALGRLAGVVMPVWLDVLLCFAFSGGFGGVLGAIQVTDIARLIRSSLGLHWTPFRFYNVALALLISSLGGMGGAFAAMLVMALDSKIKTPVEDLHRLTYIGMGTVAGFLGFRLLGKIAERVGTWLEIRDEVKTLVVRETSEKAVLERKRADDLLGAITKAKDAQLPNAKPGVVADAIAALERVREESPENRTAAMMLSWLYAAKPPKQPQRAIVVLTKALEAMKASGTPEPTDVADILYNRESSFNYRLAELAEGAERTRFKELMYRDLEESVKLKPENAKDAMEDEEDFANVRAEDRFRRLTGPIGGENPPAQNAGS